MTRQMHANRTLAVRLAALLIGAASLSPMFTAFPALALSELKQIPGQATDEPGPEEEPDGAELDAPLQIPLPDPLINKALKDDDAMADTPAAPVEVLSDITKVPQPVARMRELIVEAAASGDIERLRPLLGRGDTQTLVSSVDDDGDPIAALKALSGDPQGIEILAILLDVLSTGFVEMDKGTPDAMYVWPYFTAKPLAALTLPEKVDLLRLVTAGDFAGMEEFGSYNFYRVGITADGEWKFFIAGD